MLKANGCAFTSSHVISGSSNAAAIAFADWPGERCDTPGLFAGAVILPGLGHRTFLVSRIFSWQGDMVEARRA